MGPFTQNKKLINLSMGHFPKRARQAVKHPFSDVRGRHALQTPPCSQFIALSLLPEFRIELTTSSPGSLSSTSNSLNYTVVSFRDLFIFTFSKCNCETEQAVTIHQWSGGASLCPTWLLKVNVINK
jgi:hypothetical protein